MCDIETLSIDRIKQGTFLRINHAETGYQKLVPDPFLILLFHARRYFENKIFWNKIIKKP